MAQVRAARRPATGRPRARQGGDGQDRAGGQGGEVLVGADRGGGRDRRHGRGGLRRAQTRDRRGESVLLAAAGVVETRPATKGAYWHVKRVLNGSDVRHLWVARDGRAWTSQGAGRPVPFTGKGPFTMDGHELTIAQIEALPDEVGPLLAKVHAILGDVSEDEREGVVADAITGLLWSKPAPPDVRAAAYRALAGLSNVRYLGKGTFSYDVRGVRRELVIDRRSGQVLRATTGQATEAVLEAGWTDVKP
ncbi:hypothetical protein [Nonomuraea recticatena]|uniref:hypothetical protein n=1 Tax=Nonomuraea recticatena TaxID=46178 RepID=UPI003617B6C3